MRCKLLTTGSALAGVGIKIAQPNLRTHVCQRDRNGGFQFSCTRCTASRGISSTVCQVAMAGELGAYVPKIEVSKYEEQLTAKTQRLLDILQSFGQLPDIEVFAGPAEHYRCRTEFAIWHDDDGTNYVMYEKQANKTKPQRVKIEQYPVASKLVNSMMPIVMRHICTHELLRRKLFQVNYHTTRSGHALVTMIYHKKLLDCQAEWEKVAVQLRENLKQDVQDATEVHILGRSRKSRIVLDRDYVVETQSVAGKTFTQKQPEGSFSQPNGAMCEKMVSWAEQKTRGCSGDLLELYCGNGNFTIPLAANFRHVVATELSKVSVAAARDNVEANGVSNIFLARMSSEEFVEAWTTRATKNRLKGLDWDKLQLNTLLVDPPRAGLDTDTAELMKRFDNVVYISCNPATLAENLLAVKDTHVIKSLALFDQFPFTHHIECGVYLQRKPSERDLNGT